MDASHDEEFSMLFSQYHPVSDFVASAEWLQLAQPATVINHASQLLLRMVHVHCTKRTNLQLIRSLGPALSENFGGLVTTGYVYCSSVIDKWCDEWSGYLPALCFSL